jgi:hypothetical protein
MDDTTRARLLAVEVLLADPESLGNDALEGDLYILRDQLQGTERSKTAAHRAQHPHPGKHQR